MRRSPSLAWALLAAMAAIQVYALYLHAPAPGPGLPYLDKVAHLLIFGVPAALAAALRLRWVLVALAIHAVSSEPLQGWLPVARSPDMWDLVADLLGIVAGMLIGRGVVARMNPKAARRARAAAAEHTHELGPR
ncbi:hypothetical protein BH23ACT6_BH23ACT6_21940 [soil metagenome]